MITLDEDEIEQTDTTKRRVRCVDVVMVCAEAQLRRVEEALGFSDVCPPAYAAQRAQT